MLYNYFKKLLKDNKYVVFNWFCLIYINIIYLLLKVFFKKVFFKDLNCDVFLIKYVIWVSI